MAHSVNVTELFSLLESGKPNEVVEVKTLIHENLNATKETWLLNGLVDYYVLSQSSRCLDILVGVREPHDKHLFDKLSDCLKNTSTRKNSLLLLSHLIRKQPSWLYKIIQHNVMKTFLNILKTDTDVPNLLSAVLALVTLLPLLPAMMGQHLTDVFEIFSRLASWNTKKPASIPDVFILHLHVGVYALFHRLYALYPCNFLAYLRCYYGAHDNSRENLEVFITTIKPMLERVRLHPLLVTASKDTELRATRWKKMEPHDVIVDCAQVSLDYIEGVREDLGQRMFRVSTSSLPLLTTQLLSTDYLHHPITNVGHSGRAPFTFEDGSLVRKVTRISQSSNSGSLLNKDASQSVPVPLWSPSRACGLDTPPPLQHHVSSRASVESLQGSTGSPPDIAQEALPESSPPKTKEAIISPAITQSSNEVVLTDSCASLAHSMSLSHSSTEARIDLGKSDSTSVSVIPQSDMTEVGESEHSLPDIHKCSGSEPNKGVDSSIENLQPLSWGQDKTEGASLEPREEGVDSEVSQIVNSMMTSTQPESIQEPGHMTPFFSTTCYLTNVPDKDSPNNNITSCDASGDLVNDRNTTADGASSSLVQQFVHNINRLRYFSQCAPQISDIPVDCPRPFATLKRSHSCPSNVSELNTALASVNEKGLDSPVAFTEVTSSVCLTTSSTFSAVSVDHRTEVLSVVSTSDSLISCTAVSSSSCVQHPAGSEDPQHSTEVSLGRSSPPSLTSSTVGDHSGSLMSFMSGDLTKTVSSMGHNNITYPQPCSGGDIGAGHGTLSFSSLSPLEILDRHLQQGNDVYLKELRTVPLTSTMDTDWTHFGGNPPPDEVDILRGQIALLHSQLLYERYKRETHAERNRRLLGRAKKSRALEEQNSAMKDQLQLQEEEIRKINSELDRVKAKYSSIDREKKFECNNRDKRIRELTEENEQLQAQQMKNETLLVINNQEKDELQKLVQDLRSQLFETSQELKTYQQQANRCQELTDEVEHVNRQLMLLGELYYQCRQKLEVARPLRSVNQEQEMMKKAFQEEISALKQVLDCKNSHLESLKGRAEILEVSVKEKDSCIDELKQLLENTKDKQKYQLQAEKDRFSSLLKICQEQEHYIVDLQEQLAAKEKQQESSPAQVTCSNGESLEEENFSSLQSDTSVEPALENQDTAENQENTADMKLFNVETPGKSTRAEKVVSATPVVKLESFRNLELLLDKGENNESTQSFGTNSNS